MSGGHAGSLAMPHTEVQCPRCTQILSVPEDRLQFGCPNCKGIFETGTRRYVGQLPDASSAAPIAPPPAQAPRVRPPIDSSSSYDSSSSVESGAGGSSSSAAAKTKPPLPYIDSDWLEEKFEDCICSLCFGVMVEPTSACLEGHSFCRSCLAQALREKAECPTCRHKVRDISKLVRMRPLEGMIAQLRCTHDSAPAGPSSAKRAKLAPAAPAASMTLDALRKELRAEGLDTAGLKAALVARVEEVRAKGAGCGWKGKVGELAAHLEGCAWARVKCTKQDCKESPFRKDQAEHDATCGSRLVKCERCKMVVECRLLPEHEGSCPRLKIKCPNAGCHDKHSRGFMNVHLRTCAKQVVKCLQKGCHASMPRRQMTEHVKDVHVKGPRLLDAAGQLHSLLQENAKVKAAALSELRHAAGGASASWAATAGTVGVFNWRADGWGLVFFSSGVCHFGEGVSGSCVLKFGTEAGHSHEIGFRCTGPRGRAACRVRATFSLLDKHDETLGDVWEWGGVDDPHEQVCGAGPQGCGFTPTDEEKAQSVRKDGSIRLRAVVRVFPEDEDGP